MCACLCFIGCKSQDDGKNSGNRKPNVLIILTDDLGYGDISSFGQAIYKTPNIDRIGAEGVVASSFYVPTPYCAPSRASLLTGRFPLRHDLIKNPTPDAHIEVDTIGLAPEEVTMAEVFKDAGYATKAIGKWHLGHYPKFFPVAQGFDEYYGILYSNDMRPVQIIRDRDTVQYPVDQRHLTKDYTAQAIDFITRKKEGPFLLYLAHAMPHKPLAASKAFYTPNTPNDLYADVVRELDWGVGQVLHTLKELKLLNNTIIIFMSDNGPWYGGSTGGFKGMKATTWEGGIRVPMMVRYPEAFTKGMTVNVPIWSLDILPTICSLAKVATPKNVVLDGQDITALLQGKTTKHAPVFSMHGDNIMSVRKGDYKLFIRRPPGFVIEDFTGWVDPRGPDGNTIIAQTEQATPANYPGVIPVYPEKDIQLFNLKEDPTESNNLSQAYPELVEELLKIYNNFQENLKK
ncbi:sulfatase-like hydrolase/transferase [Tamlana fucoidanivorans]|nr:sulfatase-like hydrolase/transferase [Tamlana fucoidanivorans]